MFLTKLASLLNKRKVKYSLVGGYAVVLHGAKDLSFVEISSFANDGSGWRYLFGMPKGRAEIKTDPRKLTIAAIDA